MIATDNTPRVWVGCLACYNAGRLVGKWYDAESADELTPEDIHGAATTHEELWVMDHENLPIDGECSPMEAAKIARGVASVPDHIEPGAVRAYVENTGVSYVDWDTLADDVQEAYLGDWESIEAYAEEFFRDTASSNEIVAMLDSWPFSYIDWERAARDLVLGGDVWTADSSTGVYVFRTM